MYEFPVTGPVTVAAKLISGHLEIVAEQRTSVTVQVHAQDDEGGPADHALRVELVDGRLQIDGPRRPAGRPARLRVTVHTPLDSALDLRVTSAQVLCTGRFAAATVRSASGGVTLPATGPLVAELAGGALVVAAVDGTARVHTASGNITLGEIAGELSVVTASGDVRAGHCAGPVSVRTASGEVTLDQLRHGDARITTISGDVEVGVARGTAVWLDLSSTSGTTDTDLTVGAQPVESAAQLSLRVRCVSGHIRVHRATVVPAA
jgi:DUF4097 and DUF4098 domain-containing protein YvlB